MEVVLCAAVAEAEQKATIVLVCQERILTDDSCFNGHLLILMFHLLGRCQFNVTG